MEDGYWVLSCVDMLIFEGSCDIINDSHDKRETEVNTKRHKWKREICLK